MKRIILIAIVVALAGCGLQESHKSSRGKGDTGIRDCGEVNCIDGSEVDRVYEFNDGFPNIASKCVDDGLRAYTTSGNGRHLVIVEDAGCSLPEFNGPSR